MKSNHLRTPDHESGQEDRIPAELIVMGMLFAASWLSLLVLFA